MSRCWAYSVEGNRCELEAGHKDTHTISKTWTDDECYNPLELQKPSKTLTQIVVKPEHGNHEVIPERTVPPATKCVACHHSHRGTECKCGCYDFIG